MVPLGMELGSSHRLLIQTTLVYGAVWPQFAMQVLTEGCMPTPSSGVVVRIGSEMSPVSSTNTTNRNTFWRR